MASRFSQELKKFYRRGGGIEKSGIESFRFTYKFLNFTLYRTLPLYSFSGFEKKVESLLQEIHALKTTQNELQKTLQNQSSWHFNELKKRQALEFFARDIQKSCVNEKDEDTFIIFDYTYHIASLNGHNLGDFVQSLATQKVLERLFHKPRFLHFDRDSLSFCQENALVLMQGWFSHSYNFLPKPNLKSLFIGTHFCANSQNFIKLFHSHFPHYFKDKDIGCRDKFSLEFCEKMGFRAYFSRCLTLTFPKRKASKEQKQVFFVNVKEKFLKLMPDELKQNAKFINQRWVGIGESFSQEFYLQKTKSLLNLYKNEARLVITSALHCAAPCTALGIPVILIKENAEQSTRFSTLDGILPIYEEKDFIEKRVDFSPKAPDIEPLKEAMLENVKLSIMKERGQDYDETRLEKLRKFIAEFKCEGVSL